MYYLCIPELNMYKTFAILALMLWGISSYGQFLRADHKKAALIDHRPLLVALFDTEQAENEKDSLQMAWYNESIRMVLEKHWTLNDSIIFAGPKRVHSIIGSKSADYAVLLGKHAREGQQSSSDIFWYDSFTFLFFLSEDGIRLNPEMVDRASPLIPDHNTSGQLLRGRYIYKISLFNEYLSVNDLVFAIRNIRERVNEALEEKYSKRGMYAAKVPKEARSTLAGKTLLIPDNLAPEGINRETIAQYYEHPFRICSQNDIEKAIGRRAENTAYLHFLWSDRERMFTGMVIDAESGKVLASFPPNAVRMEKDFHALPGISYRSGLSMKPSRLKSLSRKIPD